MLPFRNTRGPREIMAARKTFIGEAHGRLLRDSRAAPCGVPCPRSDTDPRAEAMASLFCAGPEVEAGSTFMARTLRYPLSRLAIFTDCAAACYTLKNCLINARWRVLLTLQTSYPS